MPAYLLQIGAVTLILLGVLLGELGLARFWERISIFQRSILLSDYLSDVLSVGISLLIAQGILAHFARKAMIVGDHLWIKSLGYRSRTFALGEIEAITPFTDGRSCFLSSDNAQKAEQELRAKLPVKPSLAEVKRAS